MSFFGFGRKNTPKEEENDDDAARAAAEAVALEAELAAGFEEIKDLYKTGTQITELERIYEPDIVRQAVEAVHHELLVTEQQQQEEDEESSSSSSSDFSKDIWNVSSSRQEREKIGNRDGNTYTRKGCSESV